MGAALVRPGEATLSCPVIRDRGKRGVLRSVALTGKVWYNTLPLFEFLKKHRFLFEELVKHDFKGGK